jgi:hypothetical protein
MFSAKLNRGQLDASRVAVEKLMNDLTAEAEAWAESGTRKVGEVSIRPQFAPKPQAATSVKKFRAPPVDVLDNAA